MGRLPLSNVAAHPKVGLASVKFSRIVAAALSCTLYLTQAGAATEPMHAIADAELHRTADPAVVALLDAQPSVAARAALALGRTKRPEAAAPLRAHLHAGDPTVRALVAYGLGLLADPADLPAERALARSDRSSAVRYAAFDAVDRIVTAHPDLATRGIGDDVLASARGDIDPRVRDRAAVALAAFHDIPDAAALANGLARAFETERNGEVRWHDMWTLFRGYAALAPREVLTRALRDRDDLVRVEALRAWGKRSDADASQLVQPLLSDSSWHVQLEAREALHRLAKEPPTIDLTELPPRLNLPPADPQNDEAAVPRPEPTPALAAPSPDDLLPAPPLDARDSARLDGPMPGPHPRVRIRTTKGDIVVRLYPEWAPYAVANFLRLTAHGYFDYNRWFRIVPDFVVQTGDPNDNGEGDAGYTIPAEENPVEQRTGIIAMGLNYEKDHAIRDSAGTQFYITSSPQPHLDRDFSVFGEVESGMGTIARLIESDRMVRVDRLADR